MKKFRLLLESEDGDTTYINYTLLDNEAVDIWASFWDNPFTDPNQTLCFSSGKVSTERLNGLIDKFNTESKIEESRYIPRFVMSSLLEDIASLNKIHSMFEDYEDQITNESGWLFEHLKSVGINWSTRFSCDIWQILDSLDGINENVHLLESSVKDFYYPKSYTSAWLSLPFLKQGDAPLPDSVKNLFQLSDQFGDLFLGYATRGKGLSHIMKDNDLDLLRSGGFATPQQFISKGVISLFSGNKKTKWSENKNSSEEYERKLFNEWFDKNDIAQFGYNKKSLDNCLGYIKIGEFEPLDFQRDWTCEEIVRYYSKYNFVVNAEMI